MTPPDVLNLRRCYFEFFSQETLDKIDRYTGYKRYRLNKWQPLMDFFPSTSQDGLVFSASDACPLTGIASTWEIQPAETGKVIFRLPFCNTSLYPGTDNFVDVGAGFLQYIEPWWQPMEAMALACYRSIQPAPKVYFTSLHKEPVVGVVGSCGLGPGCVFELEKTATQLSITFTEYSALGSVVLASTSCSVNIEETATYRPVLFFRALGGTITCILGGTDILFPSTIAEKERIWFHQNPTTYTPPIAPIRMPGVSIYPMPHYALLEDASIELSTPMTTPLWFNLLCYLIDTTIEPMIFSDIEGKQWLTCFESLMGKGKHIKGNTRSGYDLTLPVLVVN